MIPCVVLGCTCCIFLIRLPGDSMVVIPLAVFSTVEPPVSEERPFNTVAVPVDAGNIT